MEAGYHPQLATQILGTKVLSKENEHVGIVQNILVKPESGTISYIVLCHGDFIGKMHRYIAILNFLLKSAKQNCRYLTLDIDTEELTQAPEINAQKINLALSQSMQKIVVAGDNQNPIYQLLI